MPPYIPRRPLRMTYKKVSLVISAHISWAYRAGKYIVAVAAYSDVHDQLPPPSEKYYFASVRGLASNRSERPCLAARTLLLADFAILHSVVIFVKHREVSTHTILPNFIGNCRNSFVFVFWRPQRGYAVKEDGRARASLV